jgi:hypothetical protein
MIRIKGGFRSVRIEMPSSKKGVRLVKRGRTPLKLIWHGVRGFLGVAWHINVVITAS